MQYYFSVAFDGVFLFRTVCLQYCALRQIICFVYEIMRSLSSKTVNIARALSYIRNCNVLCVTHLLMCLYFFRVFFSTFYDRPDLFPIAQRAASKQWMQPFVNVKAKTKTRSLVYVSRSGMCEVKGPCRSVHCDREFVRSITVLSECVLLMFWSQLVPSFPVNTCISLFSAYP